MGREREIKMKNNEYKNYNEEYKDLVNEVSGAFKWTPPTNNYHNSTDYKDEKGDWTQSPEDRAMSYLREEVARKK
jgi:hypothetical protein